MAGVIKRKKAEKERQKQKKHQKPFQPLLSLRAVIWDLLPFLSSCSRFSKLGLSSEEGIRDLRASVTTARPSPGGRLAFPGKGLTKPWNCCECTPNMDSGANPSWLRAQRFLGILWEKGGVIKESEYPEEPRGNLSTLWAGRGGAFTLKRNLRRQSFIS